MHYRMIFSKAKLIVVQNVVVINDKHLMTGTKGNSEFCLPETIESGGETKLTVSRGTSHLVFCEGANGGT